MKGLILCGGKGTRLRPLTFSRPKQLLPLRNKPVLFYGIESMIAVGIKEIGVVVSPMYRNAFDDVLKGGEPWNIAITLIEQSESKGLADAVQTAESFIQQDDFLLYLGDNVIDGSLQPLVDKFYAEQLDGLVAVSQVETPEQFGIVQLNGEKLVRVVEKPQNPPSNLAITGVYLFRSSLFKAITQIKPSRRGEYEITDAIQRLIDDQYHLGVFASPYWWKDSGKPKDLIACNQHYLQKMKGLLCNGLVDNYSKITTPVFIGDNAHIINSVIRGPAIIGSNTTIKNSYIGPFSSISDHVSIVNCELENSIVIENTMLDSIPYRIDESIIGGEVKMMGKLQRPQSVQLWVGDHSHIFFPR